MRAIVCDSPGDEEVMRLAEVPSPELGPGQVRVRVQGTSVNRADLLQRRGLYPPPPGATEILGLECAGEIIEVGDGVDAWRPGQRVMALLPGGGYAEEVAVDAGTVLAWPECFSQAEAAGFMETHLTAFLNIFTLGQPEADGAVLVHGGSGGVGTAAIGLAREAGLRIAVTAGSAERCARCLELGADLAINYRERDFSRIVREELGGADVILDCVGGRYLERNLTALKPGGALVIIGLMGGVSAELNLAALLLKRLRVWGSTLRSRRPADKAEIVRGFSEHFGDALAAGRLRPVIDRTLPLAEVPEAHRRLDAGEVFGKLVLEVGPSTRDRLSPATAQDERI